ncbi:hypothetical protein FZ029_21235 [Azospirillum sp. Sh1]|nr:hypothetical protein FZ029_21235 [Azospirillum sp. Sh1]
MAVMIPHKEPRHSREGGNPTVSVTSHESFLDPRLRGDDERPFMGILIPYAVTLTTQGTDGMMPSGVHGDS